MVASAPRAGIDGAGRYVLAMQHVTVLDLDLATLRRAIGGGSYVRGSEYARQGAAGNVVWDAENCALRGLVSGQGSSAYRVAAYFSLGSGRPARFEMGECSCPVEYNCKHVVALVLSALVPGPDGPQPAPWEQSLKPLVEAGGPAPESSVALAIELTLIGERGQARLAARLVRPGKNGGWVCGDLRWSKLDVLRYAGYSQRQIRLVRELYLLYQASRSTDGYYGYYYYGGDDRSIEFSAIDSPQLWPLLDEARPAGLQLVYPGKAGALAGYEQAAFSLDVTRRQDGQLRIVPLVRAADGTPAVPVGFIGADGHGAVCIDGEQAAQDPASWRFWLTRLERPVPPALQRMARDGVPLEIPAADESRFAEQYYPRLRQAADVISSDGSFTPPVITGPELVLGARYGHGHELDVSWQWAYQVGDSPLRVPAGSATPSGGYRDLAAEQELLATLAPLLRRYGLLSPGGGTPGGEAGHALVNPARLGGIDTMRFSTELLPLLDGQAGLTVEVSGEPADYREAGDSLQITVSTDEVDGDTDWFDLGVTITVDGQPVPFLDVFLALSRGEPHLLLPDGAYFSLEKPELQTLARLIAEARALHDATGPLRISRYQAGFWDELVALGVIGRQAAAWQEQVQGLLSAGLPGQTETPAGLRAQLRPYQQDGFGWLRFLWEHRLGGILADDMGLGKTLQCLALITHARRREPGAAPFLIVAPASVAPNWAAEAARFAPDLKVVTVSGTMARRGQDLTELTAGADAVVTTYTLLRLDIAAYTQLSWSGLLLDEAQQVKNRQSKVYQCARRLTAPVKIAITGTPLENNLMELWSLLSIAAPGLFPSPDRFREYYAKPVERQGDGQLLAQLQRRIKPLVRRRTKEQVAADLPAKQEQVMEVDLHPQHRTVYQRQLQRERQKVLGLIDDMDANRFAIFRSLTLLRQLSLHAGLVDEAHADLVSAKIEALIGQLREIAGAAHRALVFSQFTGFLAKVRERLEAEGIAYCYLDGRTRDRAEAVREFKDGQAPVFLISLKAGGFGLNLTEADYCFLLDPWWNPATEAQAVDRTHRIGQTRNVMVYRLVARDTIEEKVMALKARKARLFSSVLDEGGVFSTSLDADDIRGLFS